MIGGWSHTDGVSDGGRGEGEGIAVCVGSEVEVQLQRLCAQIPGGSLPVFILDAEEV